MREIAKRRLGEASLIRFYKALIFIVFSKC